MVGTSKYFNNDKILTGDAFVSVIEDLQAQAIQIMGYDCYFIPRESFNEDGADKLFGEDIASKFEQTYKMEMYIDSPTGFGGDKDYFSKFGLEIRNDFVLTVSQRKFEQYVPSTVRTRPQEGDLIFVPMMRKFFEIKYVDPDQGFYQVGNRRKYLFEMRCEQFRFSHESINTGISEIDDLIPQHEYSIQLTLDTGSGNYQFGENVYITGAHALVEEWIPLTKLLIITRPVGEFLANNTVTGETSNAIYHISSVDDLDNFTKYEFSNNRDIQTFANNIIDRSEINPFGEP